MVEFNKSKTKEILARLYAGECQDGARYQFLAKQANTDEYNYVMGILKNLATNEMAHAKILYDLILEHGGQSVKNIEINAGFPFPSYQLNPGLKLTADAEHAQFENIYPTFAKIAKDEGYEDVSKILLMIADVENAHSQILTELFNKIKNKKIYKMAQPVKWKCSKCGYVKAGRESWKICPLCKYDQGYTIVKMQEE